MNLAEDSGAAQKLSVVLNGSYLTLVLICTDTPIKRFPQVVVIDRMVDMMRLKIQATGRVCWLNP